jgi:hypothetical protein
VEVQNVNTNSSAISTHHVDFTFACQRFEKCSEETAQKKKTFVIAGKLHNLSYSSKVLLMTFVLFSSCCVIRQHIFSNDFTSFENSAERKLLLASKAKLFVIQKETNERKIAAFNIKKDLMENSNVCCVF